MFLSYNEFLFYLDVEDVKFVINLDYPSNSEDYVHRIGRTGRSQRTGTAYAFFTPGNAHKTNDLIQVLEEAKQVVNPKLYELSRNPGAYKRKNKCQLNVKHLEINRMIFLEGGRYNGRNAERSRGGIRGGVLRAGRGRDNNHRSGGRYSDRSTDRGENKWSSSSGGK